MKNHLYLLALLFSHSAFAQFCNPDNRFTELDYFSIAEIDTLLDIPYGSATNHVGGTDTVLIDAFFPNNNIDTLNARPVVVMIHGGGFSGGQKEDRWGECIEFAKRGFVAFSINYRLGWNQSDSTAQFKAMYRAHQDADAALRYIVHNASTFRIDTNWIFVGGTSAGANTANNLAYTNQNDYETLFPGISTLLGGLNNSTNTLTNTFTIKGVFNNWGSAFAHSLQANKLLPQIAFHGDADTVVAIDTSSNGSRLGSRAMHNYLITEGVCSDITIKLGGGHGIYADSNGTRFRTSRATCFFRSLFCNNCTNHYDNNIVIPDCSIRVPYKKTPATKAWTVGPNPFKEQLSIANLSGDEQFYLYNLNGVLLYNNTEPPSRYFPQLAQGMYILTIENASQTKHFKLIKE